MARLDNKMKKREIEINFTNHWLYALIVIGILAAVGIGVYAYGTSSPSVFGHSSGEIDFSGGIVTPNLTTNKICLSGVCNTAWPSCYYVPSETQLLISSDATKVVTPLTYTKAKEIRVGAPGTYTVKFVITTGCVMTTTYYGKIYVNGNPVGTERAWTGITGQQSSVFSENIPANTNDLIQLYGHQSDSRCVEWLINFRIYGKLFPYDEFAVTLN